MRFGTVDGRAPFALYGFLGQSLRNLFCEVGYFFLDLPQELERVIANRDRPVGQWFL